MKNKTRVFSIVSMLLLVVLFTSRTYVFAQPSNNPVFVTLAQVQQLIDAALSPLQAAVQSVGNRVSGVEAVNATQTAQLSELSDKVASQAVQITGLSNHDTSTDESIRSLSSRISSAENSIRLLENTLNDGHFQVSLTNESYPNGFGAWLPKIRVNATWRGVFIGDAQYHGVFSVGGSDYPVVGSSAVVAPSVTVPFSTLSGELDLYVFWQGMSQHVSTTVNAP